MGLLEFWVETLRGSWICRAQGSGVGLRVHVAMWYSSGEYMLHQVLS